MPWYNRPIPRETNVLPVHHNRGAAERRFRHFLTIALEQSEEPRALELFESVGPRVLTFSFFSSWICPA